jgi:heat-inducible transcriptional repressor
MDGSVQQQRLLLEMPTLQDELSTVTARLNPQIRGKEARELNEWLLACDPTPLERVIVNAIIRVLEQQGDLQDEGVFYGADIVNMLDRSAAYQTSSVRVEREDERVGRIRKMMEEMEYKRVQQVMDELEHKHILPALASQISSNDGVQVIIGGENQWDEMRDVSLVLARYGQKGKVSGMLGVVGPTRMQYGRAIAVVRYMSQVMNELLADLYGYE